MTDTRDFDEPDLRKHIATVLTDYKAGALDGLDDAVEAIMEHPGMKGWQGIETAPRGWLLLWTDDAWRLGFHKSDGTWQLDGEKPATPTHWMQLPAAPV